jgi:hypothetical protein
MQDPLWSAFLFLLLLLVPMIYLPRLLQREIQAVFLVVTRQPDLSTSLFALLFLPGVLLHESSHFIMAQVLGVRTGRVSLIPKKIGDGRLRLGYVETAQTDIFRDALIGIAPLLTGGIFVALVGVYRLGLNTVWSSLIQGHLAAISQALSTIIKQPDFWLWFYLVFTVSSTMMPSASDRRAWLPIVIMVAGLLGLILLVGLGSWLMTRLELGILTAINAVSTVFGITILIHLLTLPPTWVFRKLLSRLTGIQVV